MLRWFKKKKPVPTVILICMRLDEMFRVHPKQITSRCSKCNFEVGIYPSGQQTLAHNPNVIIVCNHCTDAKSATLTPGALLETRESKWRDEI